MVEFYMLNFGNEVRVSGGRWDGRIGYIVNGIGWESPMIKHERENF